MSALELVQLAMGSGILTGGLGICKWAFQVERRIMVLEVKNGIKK